MQFDGSVEQEILYRYHKTVIISAGSQKQRICCYARRFIWIDDLVVLTDPIDKSLDPRNWMRIILKVVVTLDVLLHQWIHGFRRKGC